MAMGNNVTAPPPIVDGWLPHGRWACTEKEAKAAYVDGRPGDRETIWREWEQITKALRSVVGEIAACWLSGSFFTDKPDPSDIDCLYIIDSVRLMEAISAEARHAQLLEIVAQSRVKELFGVRVDSYILEWIPTSGCEILEGTHGYLQQRGYWDNLWCRVRDADARLDAVPRRGYLEVHLDGYK